MDELDILLPCLMVLMLVIIIYFLNKPLLLTSDASIPNYHGKVLRNAPSPMPNGWVPVAPSYYVKKDVIFKSNLFNQEIVLVRSESGKVEVYDAYCPHLGAHLGHQSEVVSYDNVSCIRCPFHGWLFKVDDGSVFDVPYSKNKCGPAGVRLKRYESIETMGFICIWYHADGLEPAWILPDDDKDSMTLGGLLQFQSNINVRDVMENMVDNAHFDVVHGPSPAFWTKFGGFWSSKILGWFFGYHFWQAQITCPENRSSNCHIAKSKLVGSLTMLGIITISTITKSTHYGPYLTLSKMDKGLSFTLALLPTDTNKLTAYMAIRYSGRSIANNIVSRAMIVYALIQMLRDAKILNYKGHVARMQIVSEDRGIVSLRKWFSQFYSENSPRTFDSISPLDW